MEYLMGRKSYSLPVQNLKTIGNDVTVHMAQQAMKGVMGSIVNI